jgi:hypothetical protein
MRSVQVGLAAGRGAAVVGARCDVGVALAPVVVDSRLRASKALGRAALGMLLLHRAFCWPRVSSLCLALPYTAALTAVCGPSLGHCRTPDVAAASRRVAPLFSRFEETSPTPAGCGRRRRAEASTDDDGVRISHCWPPAAVIFLPCDAPAHLSISTAPPRPAVAALPARHILFEGESGGAASVADARLGPRARPRWRVLGHGTGARARTAVEHMRRGHAYGLHADGHAEHVGRDPAPEALAHDGDRLCASRGPRYAALLAWCCRRVSLARWQVLGGSVAPSRRPARRSRRRSSRPRTSSLRERPSPPGLSRPGPTRRIRPGPGCPAAARAAPAIPRRSPRRAARIRAGRRAPVARPNRAQGNRRPPIRTSSDRRRLRRAARVGVRRGAASPQVSRHHASLTLRSARRAAVVGARRLAARGPRAGAAPYFVAPSAAEAQTPTAPRPPTRRRRRHGRPHRGAGDLARRRAALRRDGVRAGAAARRDHRRRRALRDRPACRPAT